MSIIDYAIKVKLSEEAVDYRGYDVGRSNPAVGSDYECEGMVVLIYGKNTLTYKEAINIINYQSEDEDEESIEVVWDNGKKNVYQPGDLLILNRKYKSIW